jgi:hypothetical protein
LRPYLIVAGLALAAFAPSLLQGFHFDDAGLLSDPSITQPAGWHTVFNALQTRPLTWLTFWASYQASDSNPIAWHVVSILLHAINAALLYNAFTRMFDGRVALITAALFAVHPLQAESVAYVFSRGTELCTMFCILALITHQLARTWVTVALFGVALMAKEECAAFPLLLLLFDWLRGQKPLQWRPVAAMLGLSAIAGAHVIFTTAHVANSGAGFSAGVSPQSYLALQGFAVLHYLWLLVLPWGFTIDPEPPTSALVLGTSWAVILLLILVATWNRRTSKPAMFFLGGLILLLPSSSFFPAADFAADHRMYLPMIAFSSGAALLLVKYKSWIPSVITALLMIVTWARMPVWASDRALWTEAAQRAPHKVRPLLQLSRISRPDEALQLLNQAQAIEPNNTDVYTERGRVLLDTRKPAAALREFGLALALVPNDPHALNNRGVALEQLGQHSAAQADFQRALHIDPCLAEARRNIGEPPCPTTAR